MFVNIGRPTFPICFLNEEVSSAIGDRLPGLGYMATKAAKSFVKTGISFRTKLWECHIQCHRRAHFNFRHKCTLFIFEPDHEKIFLLNVNNKGLV